MSRPQIVINGKFLGAGLNGVHRTAAHFASLLIERARNHADVRLAAPRPFDCDPGFPLLVPEVRPGRFGAGQGWEMLTLPRIARGALLVNFCNLAPLLHGNSVVMIHDAQTFLYPGDYSGRQAKGYRALSPWIARRARRVLTVSDFSRRCLVEHGIGRMDKIDVVPNGTDHILDVEPENAILDQHGLDAGGYVLTVGSAKGYKNIRRVFEAMNGQAPAGLKLVVAGGPPRETYITAGWTPPDEAVFTGFVSDAELRALYAGARVFAFPSLTEGFGLPPVEAMQCGTPVVAARAGAVPGVCGEAALLVEPEDTAAWRAGIDRLAGPEGAAFVEKGRERAAQLSWSAAGDRLWEVLRPLL